ncbi:unnamed protein product [Caenorhabditis auriculariae]|uniref:Phosphatidic acid phosphatase type 2/haloperoxidase domain-containing protein n=1 Tax=Caenorhabditis auriculariae TaxID=2777116 RepID=A0A8S1H7E0_9PELO|nr:unnamed protein product [Caenorhabditis auriculariae]
MIRLVSVILSIPLLLFAKYLTKKIPFTDTGFFCDDTEIRYPSREDTVSSEVMHLIYAVTAVLAIIMTELSLLRTRRHFSVQWHQCFLNIVFFFSIYLCSVLSVSVSLNVFKSTSSRLRPNFIDVCKPKHLDQLCPLGSNAWVENFTCTGESRRDLHFSFPSGHAAHSIFFATFLISLLHLRPRVPVVVKIYAQFAIFVFSVYVCLSRIRDFKHRYVDVAGGGLLGFAIGMGMIELVLRGFNHPMYILPSEGFQNEPIFGKVNDYRSIP